ncbi:MAG TPA: cobalamin-binding protein [Burkholderiales bacterium]|nr:cobalamin-binding protein [Burkholderiales bacterium]
MVLAVFMLAPRLAPAAPISLTDDAGTRLVLAKPASRIVALSPGIAELVFAAGAGKKLVGVTRFSDYPPAARRIPRIGDASRIDAERMLALDPDLVIAWKTGNQAGDIARLRRLGLHVFVTEAARLSDIPRLLRAIGLLAGTGLTAQRAARKFETTVDALRRRYSGKPPVTVFYEIWRHPLITISNRQIIGDVIKLCGGVNVFGALPVLAPSVSIESVLAKAPDAIIDVSSPDVGEAAAEWRHYREIPAVRAGHVFTVNPDLVQRATPRLAEGARIICEDLDRVRSGN